MGRTVCSSRCAEDLQETGKGPIRLLDQRISQLCDGDRRHVMSTWDIRVALQRLGDVCYVPAGRAELRAAC